MATPDLATTRRRFLAYFSSVGLAPTLLPGVLWATVQDQAEGDEELRITAALITQALAITGLEFGDEQVDEMVEGLNQNLERYEALREMEIPDHIAPPMYYSPLVPGTKLDRVRRPFRPSPAPEVTRPADLDDVAFWPVTHLARLIETRQVTSAELTEMYLYRLRRYNDLLNCVVTFTDDLAREQAATADREISAGQSRGPLHGIPWGCKDIIAVPGYTTTWGSNAFKDQVVDREATVVRLLREAGAVLVAKLATGELAGGDQWFGGRTNNPWDPSQGSSGSSAGPGSATAAGLVGFALGTETSGSILSPSTRCGVTGLRPTFGRVSRTGCMTLSWTRDRIGPMCRTAEDCAIVLRALAQTDEDDLSVIDLPFNWDAGLDIRQLRVGYLEPAFHEEGRYDDWQRNDDQVLDQLRGLGLTLEPFELPDLPTDIAGSGLGAESGAFFDAFLRSGRDALLRSERRGNSYRRSRLIPAVEFLQAQRVRALVMRRFAEVVSKFDVYITPYMQPRPPRDESEPAAAASQPPPPPSLIRDHFGVANLCGYPGVSVPNGFDAQGRPTGITFMGRLYAEAEILAVAKAYQEAARWHERQPDLDRAQAGAAQVGFVARPDWSPDGKLVLRPRSHSWEH